MRKQDRIAAAQQQGHQDDRKSQPEPREQEKLKGSASHDQPTKPTRPSGRMPLPD